MRMTLYYLAHSVKNQIRKLFRTWVGIFLAVCFAIGVLFGVGAAALATLFEEEPEPGYEDAVPETPEEEAPTFTEEDKKTVTDVAELIAGGVALTVLFLSLLSAEKSGSSIFLMADVNLLFSAPLRPQSVLLFRLLMQAGTSLIASIYLIFQLPNLILNLSMGFGAALGLLGAWLLMLIYAKLLSVLCYTLVASHPALQRCFRYLLFGALALLGLGYYLFSLSFGGDHLRASRAFFNAPATRFIPIWGWLKALVGTAFAGDTVGALLAAAALLAGLPLLFLLVRATKADFYEEAMMHSEEIAEKLAAQKEKNALTKRKRDRAEKLKRDEFHRGTGATVYFHKTIYNRFRFAHFGVLTKTSETYLLLALGITALQLLILRQSYFPAVAFVLALFSFYRALENPIAKDIEQESFYLVPDSAHRKVLFSFLGGVLNSLLDLLPAFLLSALLLRAHPGEALVWLLLILSMGTFCQSVAVFIDLSLSTGIVPMIRTMIQVLFVYFGAMPAAVLIIIGFALERLVIFAAIAAILNVGITALFLAVAPLFILRGRR